MNFSERDKNQIENNALTIEKVNAQIDLIKSGMAFSKLKNAATLDKGILKVSDENKFINVFKDSKDTISMVKFVPASGAATRMFKFLFSFLKNQNNDDKSY